MRRAIVKVGEFEAVFDGKKFTSEDESLANVLNSALESYRLVGPKALTDEVVYWPDTFANLAEAIAKYCGGELIAVDPPEGKEAPEGAVF